MKKTDDAVTDLHFGTPRWFSFLAELLSIGIFSQFLSAGLGLFLNPGLLELHGGIGITLSVPMIALLAGALLVRRLRGFGWWAGIVLAEAAAATDTRTGAGAAPAHCARLRHRRRNCATAASWATADLSPRSSA